MVLICIFIIVSLLDEECVKQGVEYTPVRLSQKKPKDQGEGGNQGRSIKHTNGVWEPPSSGEENSDSEDSMSDLYPRQYTLLILLPKPYQEGIKKKGAEEGKKIAL